MWSFCTRDVVNVLITWLFVLDGIQGSGDYMMTCSRPVMSKTPRLLKHDLGLPCDLSKESWCNLPGDKYPWHAVRSFVFENQGLMRRMYGEVRQLSVLRMEFNGNSIEDSNGREFDDTFKPARGTGYASTTPPPPPSAAESTSTSTTTTTTKTTTESASSSKPDFAMPLVTQFVTVDSLTTSAATPAPSQRKVEQKEEEEEESSESGATKASGGESGGGSRNSVVHSSLDQMIKFMEDLNEGSAAVSSSEAGALPTTTDSSSNGLQEDGGGAAATTVGSMDGDGQTTMFFGAAGGLTSATEEIQLFQDAERTLLPKTTTEHVSVSSPMLDSEEAGFGAGGGTAGIISDEQVQRADVKGVNACPVKEEVVAPYWANNTRGEVLALLNLYPFEQYIHWEKCTFEHRQMYCRDGCRCEQQYRLHRLLAFDPTNECRGIFSDWFRFPSCCVCKCYLTSTDLAQERFSFNRSPRRLVDRLDDFEVVADVPDVNGVDDSHFYYKSSKSIRQPRR